MRIDVDYNKTPQRELLFWEKYQLFEIMSQYPALTIKVLLHRKVGLRRADPMHVSIMALLLIIGAFAWHSWPLGIYALVMAGCGYWQHFWRWKELKDGDTWHTYSEGISPIEEYLIPLVSRPTNTWPPSLLSTEWWQGERRIYRFLEPFIVYLFGGAMMFQASFIPPYSSIWPLGFWLAFAGAFLMIDERLAWRHSIKSYLDFYDSQIDALNRKSWNRKGNRANRGPASIKDTYGLPTGIGDDIRQRVEDLARETEAQQRTQADQQPAFVPFALLSPVLEAPNNLAGEAAPVDSTPPTAANPTTEQYQSAETYTALEKQEEVQSAGHISQ